MILLPVLYILPLLFFLELLLIFSLLNSLSLLCPIWGFCLRLHQPGLPLRVSLYPRAPPWVDRLLSSGSHAFVLGTSLPSVGWIHFCGERIAASCLLLHFASTHLPVISQKMMLGGQVLSSVSKWLNSSLDFWFGAVGILGGNHFLPECWGLSSSPSSPGLWEHDTRGDLFSSPWSVSGSCGSEMSGPLHPGLMSKVLNVLLDF